MLRINRENLRNSHETPWLILDLVMLGILFVNLTWLIFDALYATDFVYGLLGTYFPAFLSAYDPVHNNFLLVDLVFIAIFFSEFCFRWVVAIVRKEHLRWYFFSVFALVRYHRSNPYWTYPPISFLAHIFYFAPPAQIRNHRLKSNRGLSLFCVLLRCIC